MRSRANSIAAAEAGASIIHLHARDPKDGRPTPDPDVFMQFLPRIKQNCDAVINITTGGSLGMSMEDRLAAPLRAKPELCSLNMGSMNFGIFHVTDKITDWKYDWEKPYVEQHARERRQQQLRADRALHPRSSARAAARASNANATMSAISIRWRISSTASCWSRRLFVQTIFGVLGGIGPHPEDLMHMRRTADRLFGKDYQWSILAAGRHQINLATIGASMGGNVRVGLEDSIYLGPGTLAKSNAEQVQQDPHASWRSCRWRSRRRRKRAQMLKLKGGDQVAF